MIVLTPILILAAAYFLGYPLDWVARHIVPTRVYLYLARKRLQWDSAYRD